MSEAPPTSNGAAGGWRPPLWALPLLVAPALLFGLLGALRRMAYRQGWLRTTRAAVPVLSVGNLSAGGSGKTPVVDWLLGAAQERGCRPVVISRGYRREGRSDVIRFRVDEGLAPDPVALGDEPALLAARHPHVPVYVAARRAQAARLAALVDRPGIILLDDGFQHLALARDLDVVLIDGHAGLGNGRLLPLGPLREPLRAARRAHAVLLTRVPPDAAGTLRARVTAALGPHIPVFTCDYAPVRLRRMDGGAELDAQAARESLRDRPVRLVCGIAQPEAFRRSVEELGARVEQVQAHADHFAYPDAALAALDAALHADPEAAAGPLWITTEKDAVKLGGRLQSTQRLWVLEMAATPEPAAQAFFFDFIARCTVR